MGNADATGAVNDAFERMSRAEASTRATWSPGERVVWNVVAARAQKDMGGMETAFTDAGLDLAVLVEGLEVLGATTIARAWRRAVVALEQVGYLQGGTWTGASGEPHRRIFDALQEALGDRMWDLDEALAALLPVRPEGPTEGHGTGA